MKKQLLLLALLVSAISPAQVSIGTGTSVDSNAGLSTPISNWYASSLSQFIYLASEINASGNITALTFPMNNATVLNNSNDQINVWIGHTSNSSYNPVVSATGADWIPISTHTQVMANGSLTQSGTMATFAFTTPFAYNGTDNLVITVDANEPGNDGNGVLFYQTAASTDIMCLMIRTDYAAENADPFNPPLNYTGGFAAVSVQAKNTRPRVTLQGITSLAIVDNIENAELKVYPNPAHDVLYVNAENNVMAAEVYNAAGTLVKSVKVESNQMQLHELASGVYFVKLNMEDGTIALRKFIKE